VSDAGICRALDGTAEAARFPSGGPDVGPTIQIFVFDECRCAPAFEALCGGKLDVTGKNPDGTWIIDGFTFHRHPNGKEFTREDVVLRGPADIRRQAVELVADETG
jgi:hypothetical protein